MQEKYIIMILAIGVEPVLVAKSFLQTSDYVPNECLLKLSEYKSNKLSVLIICANSNLYYIYFLLPLDSAGT